MSSGDLVQSTVTSDFSEAVWEVASLSAAASLSAETSLEAATSEAAGFTADSEAAVFSAAGSASGL